MSNTMKYTSAMLFGIASSLSLYAGDQLFDFNDGQAPPGFTVVGTANQTGNAFQFSDGNPASGGYLQLTSSTTGASQGLGVVFPDVDLFTNSLGTVVSLPVKAFRIEADLRVGNGTRRPADGFSISFARPADNALTRAKAGTFGGWAGGDNPTDANNANLAGGNPESGTRTGLAISFDTWQGNWLNTTDGGASTNSNNTNDREGISVRLDDRTLIQVSMTNRNGNCYVTELNPGDACIPISQAAIDSMQTGPWSGQSSAGTGDAAVSDATYNNLSWQRFTAELDTNKQVTVTWKGRVILDHFQITNYPTSQGRLILAGRCGGSWENTHFDNIHIVTVPASIPIPDPNGPVTVYTNGFRINILDIGAAIATNFPLVMLDTNINVTSSIVFSNYLDALAYGDYRQAAQFVAQSRHTLQVVTLDTLGQRITNNLTFIVPQFLDVDPSLALDPSQIDTTQPGFKVKTFAGTHPQPNNLNWTEEQIIGLRGPNNADQTGAQGGYYTFPGAVHISNGAGGTLFPGIKSAWTTLSLAANPDNSTAEFFGYIVFPNVGTYEMFLGSDDGYRFSFGANPLDRMGVVASEFNGGRGLAEPGDPFFVTITKPGAYPFRLLWENGGGGADLQWMTGIGTNYSLVNDVNNVDSLRVYAAAQPTASLGAYVKKADPVRNAGNVVFYQPILVDIGDGSLGRSVNSSSIVLSVDGVAQTLTKTTPEAGTTRIVSQMGTNVWAPGLHTNVLTFSDAAGTNYTYSWPFTVINVAASSAIALNPNDAKPASAVDSNQKGFRIKSWQSPQESPNWLSWTEEQLQGFKGPNVAYQGNATGPNGTFVWGDQNTGLEGSGVLDLRYSSSATGGAGEFPFSQLFDNFGIGQTEGFTWTGLKAYRFNYPANQAECSALDIGTWLVFPSSGYYIFHVNSDDGAKLLATSGSPFSKLGTVLTEANVGRGVAGSSGGQVGGDYRAIFVPQAGAYPFRLVYENGGTDGGVEWSIYKQLASGEVAKILINDYSDPNSIRAYQTLTAGDTTAPYVSFVNPVHNKQDTTFWEPVVVDLTDGGGKTVNTSSIQLIIDGVVRQFTTTQPSAGVTRITLQNPNWLPTPTAHTNVLIFADSGGTTYTNTWPFTVMNFSPVWNNQPGVIVQVPASSMVPTSTIDHSQPGFRVYPHQTAGSNPGNVQNAEDQLNGLRGANIADLSLTNGPGFYTNHDVIDFNDGYAHIPGTTGYDTDQQRGEFRYNYAFSRFGLQRKSNASPVNNQETNGCVLAFTGWMEFPQAGLYAMTVNSDDGFKVSVPFGGPRGQYGTTLGYFDAGRGVTDGAAFGPGGSRTHFVFNIPAAGAYPIRCLWWNGTGGLGIEWTVYQFMPDGSVARTIVGDTNTVGAIQVYQDSSRSGPFITSISPNVVVPRPDGLNLMNLGRNGNMTFNLTDGNAALDDSSVTMVIGGVTQPVTVTHPSAGLSTITRFGTNSLPSGYYGPATLTYRDTAGQSYTLNWTLWNQNYYGTLAGGYPLGSGDPAKPGFLYRIFQADQPATANVPTRISENEELMAGIWTNFNVANLTSNTVNGYFVLNGTGPTTGLVNFNYQAPQTTGDFGTNNGWPDMQFPGLPTLGSKAQNGGFNSFATEITTYVEFPTNGTYVMGVNSDDGFRVTRGWAAPPNKGALVVNSPSSVAGVKAATIPSMGSRLLTNVISGQLIQALGTGNGSTDAREACVIGNASQLAGNIALIYRSGACSLNGQVQSAAAAGAVAVVIVQNRPVVNSAEGWFPTEMDITPILDIPAIMIGRKDGDALNTALSNNVAVVHVTLTPLDDLVNPPANSPVLGQADVGRGASVNGGTLFNVTVPQAGVYPLRLLWFQGGGGASVEWFSLVDTNRVLLNNANSTNGPALKTYYGLATGVTPTVNLTISGGNVNVDYTGTLQTATAIEGPWTEVYSQPPYTIPFSQAENRFFRAR